MPLAANERLWIDDAALLGTELRYRDPEHSIPQLTRGVPDPSAEPTIIGWYDETPPGGLSNYASRPYVWCCHCGKPTHWKGWVVQDASGNVYIIGQETCGRDHYGFAFKNVERKFSQVRERQRDLRIWSEFRPLLDPGLVDIEALMASKGLADHDLKRTEIKRASSTAFSILQKIAKSSSPLMRYTSERDFAAEETRKQRYEAALATFNARPVRERRKLTAQGFAPEEETHPIYRREERNLGVMIGTSLVIDDGDVRERALAARKALKAALVVANKGTEGTSTKELREVRKATCNALDELLGELNRLIFAKLFFEPANLARIAEWSQGYEQFRFRADGDNLVIWDRNVGTKIVSPIGELDLPQREGLEAFRHFDLTEEWAAAA